MPITGHTRLTALLGSPVTHSISPLMHNESFRLLGLDYVYLCFDVKEDTLEEAVRGLRQTGIRGFNLTMPNKNKIVQLADRLSLSVQLIGAANTIVNDNGILTAYNTDGYGFMQSVKDAGHEITGKTMTLMGIGGAAAAICAQAALDGVKKIHIFARPTSRFWNRTEEMIKKIHQKTACTVILHENGDLPALKKALEESALLVNATSVGMAPHTGNSIIEDASLLTPHLAVGDIIYNPRETKLLSMARERGCPTFNGMYMLLYQGAEAFKLWTGREMPVDVIKEKYFSE
ncbi:shikimate dehydrogenase [Lactonifactor sp. BIOML-A3]|nr:shikimate dehydrogenase [Lactonifactor sp. BIOML-A5]MSA07115.1 shikimate dehydrogenase [Lactonifactor sp. BIOML-A4]MSA11412.1 shikimate dehydrogenase [Lactonifactor sp. BIOML-A3]MSA15442.1 shikimate dehydrogenase [Lactonifactor sp. BIOML-A2]MSA36048.1 shikimate dehydrogenase [Lactonifactor sp. BIOML-A1]MSB12184.1 shikimate dehydrogenase [Lactonifactor sp. BIOML-A6]MSB68165.1 shikimate dehydrogenase [Lactonifactor sp. BIOML-A7]